MKDSANLYDSKRGGGGHTPYKRNQEEEVNVDVNRKRMGKGRLPKQPLVVLALKRVDHPPKGKGESQIVGILQRQEF